MKKTLIALAVAATAAVSGSAMAWTTGGSGNAVTFKGELTPESKTSPWEVEIGNSEYDFQGKIQQGNKTAAINVENNIPVLGIRTVSPDGFNGASGISPQISYGDAIDTSNFVNGVVPVHLKVKDQESSEEIGTLDTSMSVVSRVSWKNDAEQHFYDVSSREVGTVFYGGVGTSKEAVDLSGNADDLFPDVTKNFNNFGLDNSGGAWGTAYVTKANTLYSAYYASAIKSGSQINLTLNNPAGSSSIKWSAQLPVTVTYR
ncbi:fimbrial protein [Escherichia coli]|uniref:F4 family fimbrial subunit n=1 Tax=Escherichia coli TaxID=562 RepID=UPI000BE5FC1C|nr:fimbrial protein [Escherichia coli]